MSAESLLSNRKASQLFFALVSGRCKVEKLAKAAGMKKNEAIKLLQRMVKAGIIDDKQSGYGIEWEMFLPIFLRQAMNIYSAAMPWKFIPQYMEKGEQDFIEAACARAERELARVKVKLSGNDLFFKVVQSYFQILATETMAPDDYFEDLRVSDAIDEFEYALLKMLPEIRRRKRGSDQARELYKLLNDWYKQIQAYDTPTGSAIRAAFQEHGLL